MIRAVLRRKETEAVFQSTLLTLNIESYGSGFSLLLGEWLTAGSMHGSCFLATKHRRYYLHQWSQGPLSRCDSSAHRQVKAIFCLLFVGLDKK